MSLQANAQAIEAALGCAQRPAVLCTGEIVVWSRGFWTSSRVALAVVSWSTCCCRLSSVWASLLLAVLVFSSDGVACQGFERLGRVEPESSDENHGVMYFDITTAYDYYAEGVYR